MRLSEKTIEINYCAQASQRSKFPIFWFGLTQKQEAQAGFDVCVKLGGRLVIFQFKASDRVLKKSRRRQFILPHKQLVKLQGLINHSYRSVFYVFPLVGTTLDISRNPDLIGQSRLLDVATVPPLATPTTRLGAPRKSGNHYANVSPANVIIHSDPVNLPLMESTQLFDSGFPGTDGINWRFEDSPNRFWEFAQQLPPHSVGAVIGTPDELLREVRRSKFTL